MLKREDPFTPQAKRGKRTKDYASPAVKTPLRNMLSAENVATPVNDNYHDHTHSTVAVDDDHQRQQQQRRKRALLVKKKSSAELLSPAPGISPRAAPVLVNSPSNNAIRPSPSLSTLSASHGNNQTAVSIEQMTRSFDDWMRIAADNKINAKNTWNFALIDYFSELTFLKDTDNSINFQKASCTLDGCVKIYSSRVDAVMDETGKLLNGLNERDDTVPNKDDPDASSDEEEATDTQSRSKKKSKAPGATLEKNAENLSLRGKLEMDGATIDPLFKKTCAEFDEAAGGTLLFNLTVDHHVKVVFDSNTAEYGGVGGDLLDTTFDAQMLVSQFGADLSGLAGKQLTATIGNYSFLNYTDNFGIHDRLAASLEKLSMAAPEPALVDDNPFGEEPTISVVPPPSARTMIDYLDDGDYAEHAGDVNTIEEDGYGGGIRETIEDGYGGGIRETIEDGFGGGIRETIEDGFGETIGERTTFAFLEGTNRMKTTWAGTDHWKIKRVRNLHSNSNSQAQAQVQPSKTMKRSHEIDFTAVDVDLEQLLSKSTTTTTTNTTATTTTTTLPDDLQITSDLFTVLFLKPAWRFSKARSVERVRPLVVGTDSQYQHYDYEPVQFVAHSEYPGDDHGDDHGEDHGEDQGDGKDQGDGVEYSQNLVNLTQQPPDGLQVNYSRRAKRVDVHHLKESIWRTLTATPTTTTLSAIVHNLPSQYERVADKGDLSVQFAFICLLHLANEHGLTLAECSDGDLLVSGC